MKKKIIAIVLTISIVLGAIPFVAHAATPAFVSNGEYVYSVSAEDSTADSYSFGTGAANGKIWTDKSVVAISDGLGVTLSALSQEYVSTSTKTQTTSIAADAVFILDVTGSMKDNKLPNGNLGGAEESRLRGLSDAVNEAIETITKANPRNRIVIYLYGGGQCVEFMPLAHYTVSGDDQSVVDTNTKDKYIKHFTSGNGLQTSTGLLKDGVSYSKSQGTISNTSTQHAIANSVSGLTNSIKQETATITSANQNQFVSRKPYVIMMTDGEPTRGDRNWYNETPSTMGATSLKVPGNSTTYYAEYSALAILSASIWKDRLDAAYDEYNTALEKESFDVEWFNIGLGIEEQTNLVNNTNGYVSVLIDPSKLESVTASNYTNTNSAKYASTTKYLIQQHAAEYSGRDYSADNAYVYPSSGVGYVTFATTKEKLMNSFDTLAQKIREASAVKNIPVYSYQSEDISSNLIFTDVIGDGMMVDTSSLVLNIPVLDEETKTKSLRTVDATYDSVNNIYKFAGFGTTVAISGQTLTWTIPAEEVAMFEFKDRFNLENANTFTASDYISSEPVSLNYSVILKSNSSNQEYFSNAFVSANGVKDARTTVNYFVPGDNPYYFNLTIDPVTRKTTSSTLKTNLPQAAAKGTNKTDTAEYVYKIEYNALDEGTEDAICEIDTFLGNNGKLTPSLSIDKTADITNPAEGDTVTYTVTVTNYTSSEIKDVVVNDNLPIGLTAVGATTKTVDVPANDSVDVIFTATVDEGVVIGAVLTNTANISRIGSVDLNDKPETDCDVTVAEGRYGVTYLWTGDIPDSAVLPEDSKTYTVGTSYDVDSKYYGGYTVEAKDAYENVTEKWVFSGWSTPNNGKMQKDGVTLEGAWVHSNVEVPNSRITYDWGSNLPDDAVIEGTTDKPVLPVDNAEYVPNQEYDVDETYTDSTVAVVKDEYGNVIKEYTFSGWEDPNEGVMDDEDITITGAWSEEIIDLDKYGITYNWGTGDNAPPSNAVFKTNPSKNVSLPTSSDSYVLNEPFSDDVDTTYTEGFVAVEYDEYGNVTDEWIFSGWTIPNGGKMAEGGVTVTGEWEHEEKTVPSGKVVYQFTGNVPDSYSGNEPVDSNTYVNGQSYELLDPPVTDKVPHYTEYGNIDGYYTFDGWEDPNNGTMDEDGVTVTGNWSYETVDVVKYGITYSWKAFDENNQEVTVPSICGAIPANSAVKYEKNEPFKSDVDSNYTSASRAYTYDVYDNINGVWTFSGWSVIPAEDKMPEGGIALAGVWNYIVQEVDTHSVIYQWTNAPDSGAVLEEEETTIVTLPVDSADYFKNQPYSVNAVYENGTVAIKKDAYGNITDKWTFGGWSDTNSTPGIMDDDGAIIVGNWTYEKVTVPSGKVNYEFEGEVPDGVVPPVDENTYVPGQHYDIPDDFKPGDKIPHYDEYGNQDGEYNFGGYDDPNDGTMDEDGVTVTGEWSYEEIEVAKYDFTYSWKAFDENNQEVAVPSVCGTIPANSAAKYVKNEPFKSDIDTTFTSSTEVKVYDEYNNVNGIWKFSGWTVPEEDKMPENGIDIPGEWHLTAVEVSKGKITYIFDGDVPDGIDPPVDDNTYVPGQSYDIPDDYKPGDKLPHYDEYGNQDGEYIFSGYDDPNGGVMDEDGVVITGEWEYTPIDVPSHDIDFTPIGDDENIDEDRINVVNGDKIKVVPNGGEWHYGADTYSGSDVAVITVTDDMTIPDPTRDGYEFNGWSISTDPDGITVLTATWKEKSGPKWVVPVAAVAVAGATTAIVISSTITVASIAIATPIAVIGLIHTAKHIKEMKAEKAEKAQEPQAQDEVEIPDTGSNDNALVVLALVSSIIAVASIYIIEAKKKKLFSK